ncbi:uncharacterized protein MAM_01942 [Metarhizium album ARSEF 1941]|uniref:Uncharacterized protein n=1 Tax=Metarhizium album (strain ARSEF 1941) TaxID=1081103 RepID=A0A0B2X114_METAS|nr:uncharacterized protein MAM_01942 [Metarhizium album ARSEF 1941]KHO00019.1 hypothetical protein MAM_01942 [Metarhizium album ARSEF 1941]
MPLRRPRRANLAHRSRSTTARHATNKSTHGTQGKGADCKRKDDGLHVVDTHYSPSVKTRSSPSPPSCRDDSTDWVMVQTASAAQYNCSEDETCSHKPGQQLTATNVQRFDNPGNSPVGMYASGDNDGRRRCRRRCSDCQECSAETNVSIATQEHHQAEISQLLGPWAPVSVDSCESDVFAVGAWAMEAESRIESAFNYPRTFQGG